MTYEKVLEVFKDYLSEDDSCEVLTTSQGYLVVDWSSRKNDSEWVTSRLCQTPEHLRDVLRSRYEEYQGVQAHRRLQAGASALRGRGHSSHRRGDVRAVRRKLNTQTETARQWRAVYFEGRDRQWQPPALCPCT